MNHPRLALALGAAAALLQALMVLAFAWPSAGIAPRDVPLAVAGPPAAVAQLGARLDPDEFDVRTLPDEAAARRAIRDRDVYGAIVAGPAPKVLVASGASPMIAQALAQSASGERQNVEDVVAADPDDPRGAGFGAMVLPLVMAGIAAAVLLTLLVPSPMRRLYGVLVFGVAGGLLSALVARGWLSLVPGSYLEVAAVAGLVSLAVAAAVAGLAALLGRPGIGLGALTMLLLGNPLSGASSAPELLPQPWGALGQLLPPGAGASLMRSVAFFDGAAAGRPLAVLLCWAGAGLALLALGARRVRPAAGPVERPEPVPAA